MRLLFIAIASTLFFSSCQSFMGERIRGNGHITSRQVNVGSFNGIDVSGAVGVHLKQDPNPSVKLETDENLMEFIEVFTEGNTLVIRTKNGYNLDPSRGVVAYVSAPAFKAIGVSGASEIVGDNAISVNDQLNLGASGASKIMLQLNGGNITGDISGASSLHLSGQVSKIDMQASGASHVRAYDLVTDDAAFDCSGASDAEVTANKNLRVEASGASHIRYKGNASVSQSTSGAPSISKEG
jgi:hypothetical protein